MAGYANITQFLSRKMRLCIRCSLKNCVISDFAWLKTYYYTEGLNRVTFEAKLTEKISVDSHLLQIEMAAREILTVKIINPVFQRAHNVRGWVDARAYEIKHEMALVSALCSLLWISQRPNAGFSAFLIRHNWKQNIFQLCSCLTALESQSMVVCFRLKLSLARVIGMIVLR